VILESIVCLRMTPMLYDRVAAHLTKMYARTNVVLLAKDVIKILTSVAILFPHALLERAVRVLV